LISNGSSAAQAIVAQTKAMITIIVHESVKSGKRRFIDSQCHQKSLFSTVSRQRTPCLVMTDGLCVNSSRPQRMSRSQAMIHPNSAPWRSMAVSA
jgi:hypothetical protein